MPKARLSCWVDEEVKAAFESRFGAYTATSYIVETAMREVLDLTKDRPDLAELIRQGIKANAQKVADARSTHLISRASQ